MAEVVHESWVGRKEETEAYYRVLNSILPLYVMNLTELPPVPA